MIWVNSKISNVAQEITHGFVLHHFIMTILCLQVYLTRKGSRGHHRGRRSKEPETTVVVETGASEEKKVISGLRPYSRYDLTVTVFNSKGEGPPSEALSFNTHEGGETEKKKKNRGQQGWKDGKWLIKCVKRFNYRRGKTKMEQDGRKGGGLQQRKWYWQPKIERVEHSEGRWN